jgi:hypothetical protein
VAGEQSRKGFWYNVSRICVVNPQTCTAGLGTIGVDQGVGSDLIMRSLAGLGDFLLL